MIIVPTRYTVPRILMGGTDYYQSLKPFLISFEYSDSCDGEKSDSISIELADPGGTWIGANHPQKGAFFDTSIATYHWTVGQPPVVLDCGRFFIDEVSFRGPPATLSIKANSVPTDSKVKNTASTRAWENTDLKKVAEQIAGENQMSVDWQAAASPEFKRLEQTESSDLAFLQKKAKDLGLSIKVSKRKIIFFDEQTFEEREPSFTLVRDPARQIGIGILSFSFCTRFTDTAKSATCCYVNPETGCLTEEKYTDPDPDNWYGELMVNENPGYGWDDPDPDPDGRAAFALGQAHVAIAEAPTPRFNWFDYPTPNYKNDAPSKNRGKGKGGKNAAQRKAKKALRDKNKDKTKSADFGIEIAGNPTIAAGQTCMVSGFGFYDGKYFVSHAKHKVGGDYKVHLTIRKCLKGY